MDTLHLLNLLEYPSPQIEVSYFLMGLNAMCYLDTSEFAGPLGGLFPGMEVTEINTGGAFCPDAIVARLGPQQFVAIQGTRGWQGWAAYVQGAGHVPFGNGGGQVFAPFAAIAAEFYLPLLNVLRVGGGKVTFTGHSLGAAVAALLVEKMLESGIAVGNNYFFGAPRMGDRAFCRSWPGQGFTLNHVLDPVPFLPTDILARLTQDAFSIVADEGYDFVLQPYPLVNPWVNIPTQPGPNLTYGLIASAPDYRQSPHNTYQYLLTILAHFTPDQKASWDPFTTLLLSLGLLAPWDSMGVTDQAHVTRFRDRSKVPNKVVVTPASRRDRRS